MLNKSTLSSRETNLQRFWQHECSTFVTDSFAIDKKTSSLCASALSTVHTMTQSTLPVSADSQTVQSGILKQCTQKQFYKQIQSVTAACALSADRHAKLLSLFRPTRVDAITVFDRDDCGFADEVPFTLWAFPPSDKAWFAVLTLLRKTLRPRVYCSAETRTGQKDVFMLVQTAALNLNKHGFEAWIEDFVETIGMSAGCVCFEEYFGESMLSSLARIVSGRHVYGNFRYSCSHSKPVSARVFMRSSYQRDYSLLLSKLTKERDERVAARRITGLENNHVNYVRLFHEHRRLVDANNVLQQQLRELQMNSCELTQIVHALHRTNSINGDTKTDMLLLLNSTSREECPHQRSATVCFRRIHNPPAPATFVTMLRRTSPVHDEGIASVARLFAE